MNPSDFVKQFRVLAEVAARALNISVAVVLAQWALETGWGKADLDLHNLAGIETESGDLAVFTDYEAFLRTYIQYMRRDCPTIANGEADPSSSAVVVFAGSDWNPNPRYGLYVQSVVPTVEDILASLPPEPEPQPAPEPAPEPASTTPLEGYELLVSLPAEASPSNPRWALAPGTVAGSANPRETDFRRFISLQMLFDTGETVCTLTAADAARLGLKQEAGEQVFALALYNRAGAAPAVILHKVAATIDPTAATSSIGARLGVDRGLVTVLDPDSRTVSLWRKR